MPSLIEGEARQAVKRAVPKSANKIHAAGVVRLYIAYPNRQRWTFTGLQGAAVLANDLVGNTFWLKIVDISPANRGVIWDQEIYDAFPYNQDRVFFHTFELEDCLAAFSFADDKEAKQFKKKMDEREKNAHKNTRSKPFGVSGSHDDSSTSNSKSHSRLGGIGRSLIHGHRNMSAPQTPPSNTIPRKEVPSPAASSSPRQSASILDTIDPVVLNELLAQGLTRDQLIENADFIRSYIEQRQPQPDSADRRQKAPPPPQPLTPQDTGNTTSSRRGPPPAPPPARGVTRQDSNARPPSPPSENEPSPARPAASTFRVPPPLADAGKFANEQKPPSLPNRDRSSSNAQATPGPPPPPRPPKTPLEEEKSTHVFGVPPPFGGERKPAPPPSRATAPPPPPARRGGPSTGPPPPPSRDTSATYSVPPAAAVPPPLPPKTPNAPPPVVSPLPPPLPPARDNRSPPAPPPMPSRNDAPPPPPMPARNDAPPPPPMPARNTSAPPPPPLPPGNSGGPPAPPLPPGMTPVTANAPAISAGGAGRDGLLSDIRGGARLKKVSESEKRDRSSALVAAGGADSGGASNSTPAPAGDAGGLAGALASALAARKSKVSQSDDEDDKDDW